MKYWNKNLRSRQHWTGLVHDVRTSNVLLMRYFEIDGALNKRKLWCQNNGSTSRFFYRTNHNQGYTSYWWFENPNDALLFALKWS